jgi:hypothetical protein
VFLKSECHLGAGGLQQQDVIRVQHRVVRGRSVGSPDRPVIELFERSVPGDHVAKPAHPDKSIRSRPVPELSDDRHPRGFLRLDEVPLE